MIYLLWIVVYILGVLGSLVFQKCFGLWDIYRNNDPSEVNILSVILWPIATVCMILYILAVQLNRLSNVIVAKVCPNAKN